MLTAANSGDIPDPNADGADRLRVDAARFRFEIPNRPHTGAVR